MMTSNPGDESDERFRMRQELGLLTDEELQEIQNEEDQAMIEEMPPAPECGKLNELSLEMASRVSHELTQLGDTCTMTEASAMTEDQAFYRLRQAVRDSAAQIAMVAL